ncbi:MAG TPA: hypothetical protein VJL37_05060 [Flavobacterium sp.]|nr:hypothetical protein [Flavobacterium sp.]
MHENNTTGKTFEGIRFFIRAMQSLSIGALLLSCILTLMTSTTDNYPFNFFSIFSSYFSLVFSIIVLSGISLYKTIKKEPVWEVIQREVIICSATGCSLLLLGIVTNYIA